MFDFIFKLYLYLGRLLRQERYVISDRFYCEESDVVTGLLPAGKIKTSLVD